MNKPIHPAVAEHVMEENARLREVLRCARTQLEDSGISNVLRGQIDAVLSQQADPSPAQDEREIAELIDQRDNAEDWADKLSSAIASHIGAYIGEHSNMNCPWANALEAIENYRPAQTEQRPVPDAVWEALQRMIESTELMGPHSREDARLVARYRDRYRLLAAPIAQTEQQPATPCDHQWTDDGLHLLVCTSCGAHEDHDPGWQDMATAPRDGTLVQLLVDFDEHATEDTDGPAPTIGANNYDNDGEDRWQFAGWCWSHDHFTEGHGTPVGWLPIAAPIAQTAPQPEQSGLLEALTKCVASLDQLLPYLAKVPADTGLLNDALISARAALSAQGESHE